MNLSAMFSAMIVIALILIIMHLIKYILTDELSVLGLVTGNIALVIAVIGLVNS